ncbi:MAG TPA: putative sulfate exporter family transporter [Desulfosporosinus sp.]|nr:putative sulfate exporter family transporter [Desulfosporosinus sp.]
MSNSTSDNTKSKYSFLLKFEDYWAIWLGAIILIFSMFLFFANPPANMDKIIADSNATMQAEAERAPFKTIAWIEASDKKAGLKGTSAPAAKSVSNYFATPGTWSSDNPLKSFYLSSSDAKAKSEASAEKYEKAKAAASEAKALAVQAEKAAEAAGFQDSALNQEAKTQIAAWQKAKADASKAKTSAETKPYNRVSTMIPLMIVLALMFGVGKRFMGESMGKFLMAFPAVFIVAALAFFLGGHEFAKAWGLEYVMWAILLGFLISNTIGTPKWIMPAVQTEYYIKTGLVLLGATILINKMMIIGIPGVFVTWVVTPIVLITTFWFGQKILKMPSPTLNMVISADMSVSGVSAAISAAAACRAKKEELTLAVGISITFTAIMMVAMPLMIKALGLNPVLGGAWIGGTVDSTGAVVAAGEILGPVARDVAATIKMIQNIMIGLMAFCIAAYWALKVDVDSSKADLKVSSAMREIWNRFPKFVLGFLGASVVFTLIYSGMGTDGANVLIDNGTSKFLGSLQKWFFALAFASIGLSTNFRELAKYFKGGKPAILYVCGQSFNIALTFTMAYIMFMKVFPGITASLMQ